MREKVTAIFDIGKTNKKLFLFNRHLKEVYREYNIIAEIADEDGYPAENLSGLQDWIKSVLDRLLSSAEFNIESVNFSTYGASLIHLDMEGKVLTPLYNYTKPYESSVLEEFFRKYGPAEPFSLDTGTAGAGMLTSGLQLYWLKKRKPDVFGQIQYLSYLFTGAFQSEYTSIGCHTGLWHYGRNDYHPWVYQEGIDRILPPIVSAETSTELNYQGKRLNFGIGIHDSSAALLPYVRSLKKPFILLSTGTWNISLNAFTEGKLTASDVANGCINYMRINGRPVKASPIFLGNEYNLQVNEISGKFGVSPDMHQKVRFNPAIYRRLAGNFRRKFRWKQLEDLNGPVKTEISNDSFEEAYHQLMLELVTCQAESIRRVAGTSGINRLYIDGGFTGNPVFLELLALHLENFEINITDASLGSALGAAIAISGTGLQPGFLTEHYALQKYIPLILK
jgi:sugar (pentulose or hexulose) kinase